MNYFIEPGASFSDHSNVDKRVKDLSQKFESRVQPEYPVSRTPSFGKKKEDGAVGQDDNDTEEALKVMDTLDALKR